MPKAWAQIGATEDLITYENAAKFGVLPANVTVHKGDALFPRIDTDKEIDELNALIKAQMEKAIAAQQPKAEVPGVAQIAFDDFSKVELRVAEITDCEPIKRAKKLLKLQVNDGDGSRQIVSGIRKALRYIADPAFVLTEQLLRTMTMQELLRAMDEQIR